MRYVFAECVLDTQLYTLYRGGTTIRLRPKAFHVLQYLLEPRDHVVSKDELCAHAWPGQFISDATLEGCIKLAHQAIGDSGRVQRLIQSRRGYGYRFVGTGEEDIVQPLEQEATAAAQGPPVALPRAPAPGASAPARLPETPGALGGGEAARGSAASQPAGSSSRGLPVQGMPEGERKLVTLLSCTLVSAADGQASMDLETRHRRMHILYALAQREVHQYGGTIQQVTGDRFLAMFGAPLAQEGHAQRVVLAALGLHQHLTTLPAPDRDPAPLAVCIGLHTTQSIVGPLGEAPELAVVVIGETSRVLEALQRQAAPGTVVCSDATAPWIKGLVRLQAVRPGPGGAPHTLLKLHTILGAHTRRLSGVWRARQWRGPFVGRTHELATLHTLLAQVEAGRGQMVGIVGAPGIGKSRLLVEFRHRLRGRRLTYLRGCCLSYGQLTPYLPVLDLLRHAWGITPADRSQEIATKVPRGLYQVGMVSDDATALLLALLGVEEDPAPLAALLPEVRKARTFATLVQLCLHGSQQRPLQWRSRISTGAMRPQKNGWRPSAPVLALRPSSCWRPTVQDIGQPGSTHPMPRS